MDKEKDDKLNLAKAARDKMMEEYKNYWKKEQKNKMNDVLNGEYD